MDNALAHPIATPLGEPNTSSFAGRLAALPVSRKLTMGLGALALAAAIWALVAWNSTGDYKVLYANLSDKDGGGNFCRHDASSVSKSRYLSISVWRVGILFDQVPGNARAVKDGSRVWRR